MSRNIHKARRRVHSGGGLSRLRSDSVGKAVKQAQIKHIDCSVMGDSCPFTEMLCRQLQASNEHPRYA